MQHPRGTRELSTAQSAQHGGAARTPSGDRSESVARGLMRPASLAVITAFAAVGAALPLAFDHGSLLARTARHAAVARHGAAPDTTLPRSGGSAVAPVSEDGFDAGWGIADAAQAAAPAGSSSTGAPAAPPQTATDTPAAPAPPSSPTPAPLLAVQVPTPPGPTGVSVDGTAPTSPTSATVTAPVVGPTTVASPLPSAPALP